MFLETGGVDLYVPGAQPIAVVIHDETGVPGEFSVTDSHPPQTRAFLSLWAFGVPVNTVSGCMEFGPSFGQSN